MMASLGTERHSHVHGQLICMHSVYINIVDICRERRGAIQYVKHNKEEGAMPTITAS